MNWFCNLSYAIASAPPLLIFNFEDDKVTANLKTIQMLLKWLDASSRSIRLVPIDVGNVANLHTRRVFSENKAEIMPLYVPISSIQPIGQLTPIVGDQKISMFSLAPEAEIKPRDILNFLNWELLIFGGLIVLTALLMMQILTSCATDRSIWRTLSVAVWSTITLIFLQNFSLKIGRKSKILLAGAAISIFLLITMLNCLINTDLVIGEKPFTLDKLEDVLDPRASRYIPVWRKFDGAREVFSKSDSQIKQKIWQKAERIGLDKCLMNSNLGIVLDLGKSYSDTPVVGFDYEVVAFAMRVHSCGQLMPVQGKKVHIGSESISYELLSFTYNLKNDSCKGYKQSGIQAWTTAMLEANVFNDAFIRSFVLETLTVTDNPFEKWRCLFNKDPFDQEKWLQIGMQNMNNLFAFLFCGILFSLIILLSEIAWVKLTQLVCR